MGTVIDYSYCSRRIRITWDGMPCHRMLDYSYWNIDNKITWLVEHTEVRGTTILARARARAKKRTN